MKFLNYSIVIALLLFMVACANNENQENTRGAISSTADAAANKTTNNASDAAKKVAVPSAPNDLAIEEDIDIEPPRTAEPPPMPPMPPVIEEVPEDEPEFMDQSVEPEFPSIGHDEVSPPPPPTKNGSVPPPPPPPPPSEPEVEEIFMIKTQQAPKPSIQDKRGGMNTESYELIVENDFKAVTESPLSTFSVDVDRASYSNCRRYLNMGQLPPPGAVRIEEFVNYFNYEYPQPNGEHPFSVSTEIGPCPWNKDHKLLHVGLQAQRVEDENLPPSNLVFLLDVSGSMNSPDKLPLLKGAFKLLINQLRAEDRVAIVVYAGSSGVVLPSTSGKDKIKIWEALDQLNAGGSTAGAEGIELAYKIAQEHFQKEGNNRVILATDGDFNVGMSSDAALVKLIEEKRNKGVFLSVFGFGGGNYKDTKMEKLADNGNGNYSYIDNIKEAKKVLVNEMGSTLFTIAKDVKLQLEFNPKQVKGYRLLGYENRVLKKEDFNNDKKDAGDMGAGHSVTAVYELIPANSESGEALLTSVDPLKYQQSNSLSVAANSNEWMTVKLRYKAPDSNTSKLFSVTAQDGDISLKQTSGNYRLSAGIIAYAMILRNSKYKANCTYKMAKQLVESRKGQDQYTRELVELIDLAKALKINQ